MSKICCYVIGGVNLIDLNNYALSDLSGNAAFAVSASVPAGYADISSITNWDKYGVLSGKDFKFIRNEIKLLRVSAGYSNLSSGEKVTVNKWFAS